MIEGNNQAKALRNRDKVTGSHALPNRSETQQRARVLMFASQTRF